MQATDQNLARLEDEYRKLWNQRQFFAAIARLGKIWWRTEYSRHASGIAGTRALLIRQEIPAEARELAMEQARGTLRKLEHILEAGDICTVEEAIVLVSLRTDLWLVESYLRAVHAVNVDVPLDEADAQIRELARDPAVRRLIQSAEEHVERHGGMTLRDCGLLDTGVSGPTS
jgi:hypothetical protein